MLHITPFLILLISGAIAGFFAGLLGAGGGIIIVPALYFAFSIAKIGGAHAQHLALGTSLAVMLFTSFSNVLAQQKKKAISWNLVKKMAPSMFVGALIGSLLAGFIPALVLRWVFMIYVYMVGMKMLLSLKSQALYDMPRPVYLKLISATIGMISSWIGIGGGSMSVPFMIRCNVQTHKAMATNAALTWPIALAGTLGYLIGGLKIQTLPKGSIGFIYLPAMLILLLSSILVVPVGVRLAHGLTVQTLKKIFAVLMLCIATKMLFSLL